MPNFNLMQFATSMLQRNKNIPQNPMTNEMVNAIQSGDSKKGEQLARNICQSYGISPEEAFNNAQQFFGIGGNPTPNKPTLPNRR